MRIGNQILDPHWQIIDSDPDLGHFLKIYWAGNFRMVKIKINA